MTELKPCPFCGGEAEIDGYVNAGTYFVQCVDQYLTCFQPITNACVDEKSAIEMWNKRSYEC